MVGPSQRVKILAMREDQEGKIIDRMLLHTPDSVGSSSRLTVPLLFHLAHTLSRRQAGWLYRWGFWGSEGWMLVSDRGGKPTASQFKDTVWAAQRSAC